MLIDERNRAAARDRYAMLASAAAPLSAHDARLRAALLRGVRDGAYLVRCAWCEGFRVDEAWYHAPLGLMWLVELADRRTTHGICPNCLASLSDHL